MEEAIASINHIFENNEDIEIIESIKLSDKGFEGTIKLEASPKEALIIHVVLSNNYPFFPLGVKSSKFICKNIKGYLHMNGDNSICFITPQSSDLEVKLSAEISQLKTWRDKYYIREEKDEKYEYLLIPNQNNTTFFFTDIPNNFLKNDFGYFEAKESNFLSEKEPSYFISRIGTNEIKWSSRINKQPTKMQGLFYFIENEPIQRGNISYRNWQEFNSVFSQQFFERLHQLKKESKPSNILYLLIGYKIPNSIEIHWQALQIPKNLLPIKSIRRAERYYEYRFIDQTIQWNRTINISYPRFFGRGGMSSKFQEKKILIIGCGAIGSSLAKILVRGGCRFIDISDFEFIEPGNICRSEYFLSQYNTPKVLSLISQICMISPFLESHFKLIEKDISKEGKNSNKNKLNNYDYIFDCSSDNELCVYLDSLKLNSSIINLSISNKAKELVCVVGKSTIWQEVKANFSVLENSEEVLFYEGTGCWHPTFEASFFDINSLLNLAIKNINNRIDKDLNLNTFLVKCIEKNGYINLEIIDY